MLGTKELLPGTLDMLILKALSLGPVHGYGVLKRIEATSQGLLSLEQGSLYPALYRLESRGWISASWEVTSTGRRAKVYSLSTIGRKQLAQEESHWAAFSLAVNRVLGSA